jgi:hypothetical protein
VVLALALVSTAGTAQEPKPLPPPSAADVPVIHTPPPTLGQQEKAAASAAAPPPEVKNPTPPKAAFVTGEGFRVLSEDGDFKLRVGLQAATSYVPTYVTGQGPNEDEKTTNWSQFRVPFARLRVDGNLFKSWIRYWFSFEFSSFPPFLLDGYIEAQPHKFFGVRLGQFFTPVSRHEYLGPQELLFPDWAITADYFWTGRDKGVQVFGEGDYLWYYFGFFGGSGLRQTFTTPGNYQVMGRVTLNPLGKMGWGEIPYVMSTDGVPFRISASINGWAGRVTPSTLGFNPSNGFFERKETPERFQTAAAGDFQLQWDRFGFFGEVYGRRIESKTTPTPPFWQAGAWAQANVTFYKKVLDLAVRVNWIDPSLQLTNDQFFATEVQLAWFIKAPYVILRLRYAYGHQQNPGPAPETNPQLFDVVQLPYSTGTGHQVTLQASAYF